MATKASLPKLLVAVALIAGAIFVIGKFNGQGGKGGGGGTIAVNVPNFSPTARQGEQLFEKNCMACHGKNAGGSDQGPTLIHNVYRSRRHADQAFVLAAKLGVRAHHWRFGNMPRQPKVSDGDVLKIVEYIREIQRANGIN